MELQFKRPGEMDWSEHLPLTSDKFDEEGGRQWVAGERFVRYRLFAPKVESK